MDKFTDEEKALLTEEELAGLEEDDADEQGADENGAGDAEDDDKAAAAAAAPAAAPAAPAAPEVAPAAEPAAAAAPAAAADPADDDDAGDDSSPARPAGDRVDATAVQTQIDALTTQKTKLAEQLDEGEITTKEYAAKLDALNDEKNALSNALSRQQEQDDAVMSGWYREVDKFLSKHPEVASNDTRKLSFDAVVRRVTGDPENASLSNRKQLEKARDIWRSEMGYAEPAKEAPAAEPKPAPKPKPKAEIPPTLHNVPAADINDSDDGKYSHLDALMNAGKFLEYEAVLAKLPDADQNDYLSRP